MARNPLVIAWKQFPPFARFGVLVIVLGTIYDTMAHLQAPGYYGSFTPAQQTGHLIILAGMVITLAAVVLESIFPPRRSQTTIKARRYSHANR
ncbi:MAG TPA: hypothetical protein VIT43_01365 [Candidatus Dormibacteraeota bacterium]